MRVLVCSGRPCNVSSRASLHETRTADFMCPGVRFARLRARSRDKFAKHIDAAPRLAWGRDFCDVRFNASLVERVLQRAALGAEGLPLEAAREDREALGRLRNKPAVRPALFSRCRRNYNYLPSRHTLGLRNKETGFSALFSPRLFSRSAYRECRLNNSGEITPGHGARNASASLRTTGPSLRTRGH